MTEVKARIDEELCVGTGVCEATAPDLFEIGDDGISHVLVDFVPEDRLQAAREAAANCPTRALKVD